MFPGREFCPEISQNVFFVGKIDDFSTFSIFYINFVPYIESPKNVYDVQY